MAGICFAFQTKFNRMHVRFKALIRIVSVFEIWMPHDG